MAFQAVFLMAAFHASLNLKPALEPAAATKVDYEQTVPFGGGMALELKCARFQINPSIF